MKEVEKKEKKILKEDKKPISEEKEKESFANKKVNVSHVFILALAIVSILGFIGIMTESFFEFNMTTYIEALLMLIIGIALIIEAKIKSLRTLARGFNSNNFAHLVTAIIGAVAIVAGIFTFPPIAFNSPAFIAIKGILSIIAIAIIIIQTWVIK